MKTIAIDLDDTLNNFTETLQRAPFAHDASYAISEEVFQTYLERLRKGQPEDSALLSTEFSFFAFKIHQQCYRLATARADGIEFMQWLKAEGWRIVICTHRDLRRSDGLTRIWLQENRIPFDHLFRAWNKVEFCRAWGIAYLVDDHRFNVAFGSHYGIQVFYPLVSKHQALGPHEARGFETFDEVRKYLKSA